MIGIDGHVSFLPHTKKKKKKKKAGSAGWLGPFSGAGTHKATKAIHPSKQSSPPSVESRVQQVRAKLTYPEV